MRQMTASVKQVNTWVQARPMRRLLMLAAGAAVAYGFYRWGRVLLAPTEGLPADQRSLFGRFVAWPGGTWIPFAMGSVTLGLLLVPDCRLDGRWRWRAGRVAWWATLAFVILQVFDDHILDQPGTVNPSGIAVPSPFQDLLEIACLALLGIVFVGAVVTLPARVLRRRTTT